MSFGSVRSVYEIMYYMDALNGSYVIRRWPAIIVS